MNYIVVDIGNTSTRICLLDKNFSISKSIIFDTKKISKKNFFNKIIKRLSQKKSNKNFIF